jgi:fructose-1-phosphate kinase PfkB-like protein
VAVDTHGAALAAALDARPELVKVNRVEAAELLGVDPAAADLGELAARIRVFTSGVVVLTDGRAGSLGMSADGTLRAPAPSRLGRFPVGSGDAFLGGLVAALDRGDALADALRIAAAAGAANALVPGPGVLDPRQVAEIAAETGVAPDHSIR